ncbi:MAG: 50S ribosomal protein L13 [Ignavibacteria bacterium]
MKTAISKSIRTTKFATSRDNPRKWVLFDAENKILGRLASEIAKRIRGKHNPQFTPNADVGDWVIVINAEKVKVTGKRVELKDYKRHSLYPGGQKITTFKELIQTKPERVIELAVKRMLPKNRLGKTLIKKLKVYRGPEHPHTAQKPELINF